MKLKIKKKKIKDKIIIQSKTINEKKEKLIKN